MSLNHLYNQTINVVSVTEGTDDVQGIVETETPKYTGVPCLLEIANRADEREELLGRKGIIVTHWFYADATYTIVEKDRIIHGTDRYDVVMVDNVQLRNHHLEIATIRRA